MAGAVDPRDAAAAFCRDAGTCRVEPLGYGNINDTFAVHGAAGTFVLQKINGRVFPEPLKVIHNFQKITSHLLGRQQEHGRIFQTAQSVRTLHGELFHRDPEGDYWRAQTYLAGTPCRALSGTEQVARAGRALALFHLLSADLDVAGLEDPLPGFHNLPGYMEEFERVLTHHRLVMDEEYDYCLAVLDRVGPQMSVLEDAKQAGILAIQPIHGDPKIDNFIFSGGGEADGMLDFDTVGAGLIHYDLGDCLRSCCNRAGEKGPDPSAVSRPGVLPIVSAGILFKRPESAPGGATGFHLRGGAFDRL